jgi:hypothetical protein
LKQLGQTPNILTLILNENGVWALGRLWAESNLGKMDGLQFIIVKSSSDSYVLPYKDTTANNDLVMGT